MDGIFGVGLSELIIIALVVLIIGGPRNAVKWSRELGRMMRKVGLMYQQMMREIEKDLGADAKELIDTTRELTRSVNQLRSTTDPRTLTRQAAKLLDETVGETKTAFKEAISEADAAIKGKVASQIAQNTAKNDADPNRYSDWLPKE